MRFFVLAPSFMIIMDLACYSDRPEATLSQPAPPGPDRASRWPGAGASSTASGESTFPSSPPGALSRCHRPRRLVGKVATSGTRSAGQAVRGKSGRGKSLPAGRAFTSHSNIPFCSLRTYLVSCKALSGAHGWPARPQPQKPFHEASGPREK